MNDHYTNEEINRLVEEQRQLTVIEHRVLFIAGFVLGAVAVGVLWWLL